ncbi:MAG: GrpB family protein [Candidatus Heimdallarchaeota archaeon]|nr:GrpB family protein [Candidatus Heimdallarchaeota archaeon]
MIGLKRGFVKLSKYNPKWKTLFEDESTKLLSVASGYFEDVQHIGSTAVPDIVSKPIIDILAAINSLSNIVKIIDPLKTLGYIYRGEQGIPGRHLFVKGGEDYRTHHLHIVEKEHSEWTKHTLFRDYLRKHPKEAQKYSKLKQDLLKKYECDREKYTSSKSDFIERILEKAKQDSSI